MKVDTIQRDIQRSGSFEEKTMGLAKGSEAFVFNVLRKDLYSDPIGSLIREYAVNAQDEHRKFGETDTPIFIQVPNSFLPELRIRDYAGGLTEEQVFEFFGNYGASDKRDSNVAVGFFGLGCKSAFAYTDSYVVKSFKDGVEHTFNIYIDETEVGKVAKLSSEPTTEPNGVMIIVPVKSHDINRFQEKVVSTVKYFKTTPVLSGFSEAPEFEKRTPIIKGDDWEFFGNGTVNVIMGEIAYPLSRYSIPDVETWESHLLTSDLNLYLNIGDVQVTASREALQMSPKTIDAIRAKLKEIRDTMVSETQKAFDNVKNLIEAKTLYHTAVQGYNGYARIVRDSGIKLVWNGVEVKDNLIQLSEMGQVPVHKVVMFSSYRDKISMITTSYLTFEQGSVFYFDDTDGKQVNYKRRARTLFDKGVRTVTLIQTSDVSALETMLGVKVTSFESFNAVEPTKASRTTVGGGVDGTKKVKHLSKVFVLNRQVLRYGWGAASEAWEIKEVDTSEGIYVPIERFKPVLPNFHSLESLNSAFAALKDVGIEIDVPIYGIKKGGDTGNLTRLDEWINDKLKGNEELIQNYSLTKAFEEDVEDVYRIDVKSLPDGSVAKEYATAYRKVQALRGEMHAKYAKAFRYSNVVVKPDETLINLSKQFTKKYPLVTIIESYHLGSPLVVEYIKSQEEGAELSAS